MNEDEKEAVNGLKHYVDNIETYNFERTQGFQWVRIALNLIENQQKELDTLKEIEKSHQEENGKLRVELEQEKEKNKELEEKLNRLAFKTNQYMNDVLTNNIISKDKIKEIYNILGEYRHFSNPTNEQIEQNENAVDKAVNFIKELLEEE